MEALIGKSTHNLFELEQDVQVTWNNLELITLLDKANDNKEKRFNFVDGPPFVSSPTLHYGHMLIGYIKDTILRHRRMNGYEICNKIGFDCHGLPIEACANKLIERRTGIKLSTREDVQKYGVDNFNDECSRIVDEYSRAWTCDKDNLYELMGRVFNMNNHYKTSDPEFMDTVLGVFKRLYDKGLIYIGYKVIPYSYGCCTVISNFEADNYANINTTTCFVKFVPQVDQSHSFYGVTLLVWTTTPWSLPCNVALCVHPTKIYVQILCEGVMYVIMQSQLKFTIGAEYTIIREFVGQELVGMKYAPIMNYYDHATFFQIISAEWVGETGTGIVHLSPGFGQEDLDSSIQNGIIELNDIEKLCLCPINETGCFTSKISEWENKLVWDASKDIIRNLTKSGIIYKTLNINHKYPMCPRTDTKLISRAVESVFVDVPKIKDLMLAKSSDIVWLPNNIANRFNNWLQNAASWCISRNRYFGTPILYYVNEWGVRIFESIKELSDHAKVEIKDLHNDIYSIVVHDEEGRLMHRIGPFIFDCWFESGSVMQYLNYSADFICEGLDQTRGWFYTLMVIEIALNNTLPYKNVMCAGILLNSEGQKFSKRLENYENPSNIIRKYGSDAVRLYLINSVCSRGCDFKFNAENIKDICKKLAQLLDPLKFLCVSLKIFATKYDIKSVAELDLNVDNYDHALLPVDRWVCKRVADFQNEIDNLLEHYNTQLLHPFDTFLDDLNNSYIRTIRSRCKDGNKEERLVVLSVLCHVMLKVSMVCAPFLPYLSEYIYKNILSFGCAHTSLLPLSVHLTDHSTLPLCVDVNNLEWVSQLLHSITLVNRLRSTNLINLKKPLLSVTIHSKDKREFFDDPTCFQEQTNVLNVKYDYIGDRARCVIKPNNKTLGAKFGKGARAASEIISKMDPDKILSKEYPIYAGTVINEEYFDLSLVLTTPSKNMLVDNKYFTVISIDTTETEEIMNKYALRMFTNGVQKFRKVLHLQQWNVIDIYYDSTDDAFNKLICDNVDKIKITYPIINKRIESSNERIHHTTVTIGQVVVNVWIQLH